MASERKPFPRSPHVSRAAMSPVQPPARARRQAATPLVDAGGGVMPRSQSLIRALGIIQRLQAARVSATLAELAGDTGVCTRTIRRDLEAIEAASIR